MTKFNVHMSFWFLIGLVKVLSYNDPPTLTISVNGKIVDRIIDVDENNDVIIECNATGLDPPVPVSLAVDEEPLILDEALVNNNTQTAYASSHLTVLRSHDEIECIDSAKEIPTYERTIQLNVTYPPNCTLIVEESTTQKEGNFHCTCDGNPEPTKYTFTVDGKIIQQSVSNILSLDETLLDGATNITCWAYNGKIGVFYPAIFYFGSTEEIGLSGGAIAVIIIASFAVVVVGIVIFFLLLKTVSERTPDGYSGTSTSET